MTTRPDIYADVTARIVAQLEQGVRPWAKPWGVNGATGALPPLPIRANGERYRGVNVLLLWGAMQDGGYVQRRFMTFKQALEAGGGVRRGERGHKVVYASTMTREAENAETGETEEFSVPFMRAYTVFNIEQIDGLSPTLYDAPPPVRESTPMAFPEAEAFFNGLGIDVRHGGQRAYYAPGPDSIQLPPLAAFRDAESYYATRAHETVHWTGHDARLARTFGRRFGDKAYAAEELVAELGAAFLAADLGLYAEPREDHAAYLAHWLTMLKADKRAIFTAASAAQKAADFINALASEGREKAAA